MFIYFFSKDFLVITKKNHIVTFLNNINFCKYIFSNPKRQAQREEEEEEEEKNCAQFLNNRCFYISNSFKYEKRRK